MVIKKNNMIIFHKPVYHKIHSTLIGRDHPMSAEAGAAEDAEGFIAGMSDELGMHPRRRAVATTDPTHSFP